MARVRSDIQRHVDAVVVLDEVWKHLLEPMIGPVEVVPNPIDPIHSPAEGSQREGHHLLVMGRRSGETSRFAIDVLASVRQQHPSVHLHLTGGQPVRGMDGRVMAGCRRQNGWPCCTTAGALLLPSRFEGQPLAALEALACGIPVIADADLAGLPETVVRPSKPRWKHGGRQCLRR